MYALIVAWITTTFQLGDVRRSRALGEFVWGLLNAQRVTYAAIGRGMGGNSKPASNITRVSNWCHNRHVDPLAIQLALARTVFESAACHVAGLRLVTLAMDWHKYNNATISGLRVSLVTGSRAIPLLWNEVRTENLKGRQTSMELEMATQLVAIRPAGVKFLVLLDSAFRDNRLFEILSRAGYFIVRCRADALVHFGNSCWTRVDALPVNLNQSVEFGWVHWNAEHPFPARIVGGRITDKKRVRRGKRRRHARPSKSTNPGLCVLATNLPTEAFAALDVIRIYGRRFEIEHSFRDIKNATLGFDMEHTDLEDVKTYSRVMCIVALADLISWLVGADAERTGLHRDLSPARPRDNRRTLSRRKVGLFFATRIAISVQVLLRRHLRVATKASFETVSRTWRDPEKRLIIAQPTMRQEQLAILKSSCRRKSRGEYKACTRVGPWFLENQQLERVA